MTVLTPAASSFLITQSAHGESLSLGKLGCSAIFLTSAALTIGEPIGVEAEPDPPMTFPPGALGPVPVPVPVLGVGGVAGVVAGGAAAALLLLLLEPQPAAASAATLEAYRAEGLTQIPARGPWAACTVAGTVSGWALAHEYSRTTLLEVITSQRGSAS